MYLHKPVLSTGDSACVEALPGPRCVFWFWECIEERPVQPAGPCVSELMRVSRARSRAKRQHARRGGVLDFINRLWTSSVHRSATCVCVFSAQVVCFSETNELLCHRPVQLPHPSLPSIRSSSLAPRPCVEVRRCRCFAWKPAAGCKPNSFRVVISIRARAST